MLGVDPVAEFQACLFQVLSPRPLRFEERFIAQSCVQRNGRPAYQVIGSRGTDAILESTEPIQEEPFLLVRLASDAADGSSCRYDAITLSSLRRLTESCGPKTE